MGFKYPFMLYGHLPIYNIDLIIALNWLAWPKFAFKSSAEMVDIEES